MDLREKWVGKETSKKRERQPVRVFETGLVKVRGEREREGGLGEGWERN